MHFEALGFDYARKTPALAAYVETCKQRSSVQRSGWLETFAAFVRERAPESVLAR